ncbi:MAG: hypothetical protein LBM66_05150 [Bifidobacteriaceae bacterium]|jgi:hypothetical protein|nr:hypothetical protein [Bifidobacteriaceae bacterium]
MTPRQQAAYAAPDAARRRALPDVPASVSPRYGIAELRDLLKRRDAQFDNGTADDLPVAEAMAQVRAALHR